MEVGWQTNERGIVSQEGGKTATEAAAAVERQTIYRYSYHDTVYSVYVNAVYANHSVQNAFRVFSTSHLVVFSPRGGM